MAVIPELKVKINLDGINAERIARLQWKNCMHIAWEDAEEGSRAAWIQDAEDFLTALSQLNALEVEEAKPAPLETKKGFYVVSVKYSNGSEISLWRPNACGYTSVLEYAGIYTAEEIAAKPDYYDNGWASIAVPCEEIEKLCLRVIGNTDKSVFTNLARERGLKDGTPINGFAQDSTAVRCEAVHSNGERCTRVLGHGKLAQSSLGLFHITPSDFVWYTEGLA